METNNRKQYANSTSEKYNEENAFANKEREISHEANQPYNKFIRA